MKFGTSSIKTEICAETQWFVGNTPEFVKAIIDVTILSSSVTFPAEWILMLSLVSIPSV